MAVDLAGPLLATVLACATAALDPAPAKAFINAGVNPPWDSCGAGSCGQVWARLISMTPTTQNGVNPCGVIGWVATVGVGVIRCVATVDDGGVFPTGDVMTGDGLVMTGDMSALMEALLCCSTVPRTVERWVPLGAQGGCAGGEWTLTYRLGTCPCPQEGS